MLLIISQGTFILALVLTMTLTNQAAMVSRTGSINQKDPKVGLNQAICKAKLLGR